jgi:hypothetical protein
MNDRVLNEMKVAVEQSVRPVRASDVGKRRMREELLDHLTAIYEEESERHGDEQTALMQAKERFGDPDALTDELRRSVSWREFVGYVSDLYRYHPGESLLGFASRHLLLASVTMAGAFLFMLPVIWLRGRIGELGIALHVVIVIGLFSAAFAALLTFIAEKIGQVLYGRGSPHPVRAIVGYCLASLLVFPLLTAFTYGGLLLSLSYGMKGLLLGCTVAPVAPLFFFLFARQMKEQISHENEWAGLETEG